MLSQEAAERMRVLLQLLQLRQAQLDKLRALPDSMTGVPKDQQPPPTLDAPTPLRIKPAGLTSPEGTRSHPAATPSEVASPRPVSAPGTARRSQLQARPHRGLDTARVELDSASTDGTLGTSYTGWSRGPVKSGPAKKQTGAPAEARKKSPRAERGPAGPTRAVSPRRVLLCQTTAANAARVAAPDFAAQLLEAHASAMRSPRGFELFDVTAHPRSFASLRPSSAPPVQPVAT